MYAVLFSDISIMNFGLLKTSGAVLCVWTCLSLSTHANATDAPYSEQAFLEEMPIVLTASRLAQPLSEVPNAVTVIDQSMIKASGFRNIADLFRLVPGMYVGQQNGYTPIVSYHGTTDNFARRMQVLVDGRSVYLPPFGGVNWDDISLLLEDIERIEVIRGPAAASHGANSTQGVINIITRDASGISGASVSVRQGESGLSDVSARFGNTGDRLDYRFSLGQRGDKGYVSNILNDNNQTRIVNLNSNFRPNGQDVFDLQLGLTHAVRGEGIAGRLQDPFRNSKSVSGFQKLTWARTNTPQNEFKVHYYHIHLNYADDAIDYLPGTSVIFPKLNLDAQRHDIELQHTAQWSKSNRLVWGLGFRSDAVDAPLGFARGAPTIHQSRVFAHDEWRMTSAALMNMGAMWEDDGMGHFNVSPRASFNFHLTPQHSLRIGASVAYRNPVAFEEYANTQAYAFRQIHALGGLQPEKMLSREVGYLGDFPAMGLSADVRVFSDQMKDLIFVDPILYGNPPSVANSFKNIYAVKFRGFESTIKYRWSERSNLILNVAHQLASCGLSGLPTNYAYPQVAADLQKLMLLCPKMVPMNSGSLLLAQHFSGDWLLSAGYYYQDELQVLDAVVPQSAVRRIDIKIAKAYGHLEKSGGGEVALVVQNVFQDNYTEYTSSQEKRNLLFNRRAYITAIHHF